MLPGEMIKRANSRPNTSSAPSADLTRAHLKNRHKDNRVSSIQKTKAQKCALVSFNLSEKIGIDKLIDT